MLCTKGNAARTSTVGISPNRKKNATALLEGSLEGGTVCDRGGRDRRRGGGKEHNDNDNSDDAFAAVNARGRTIL